MQGGPSACRSGVQCVFAQQPRGSSFVRCAHQDCRHPRSALLSLLWCAPARSSWRCWWRARRWPSTPRKTETPTSKRHATRMRSSCLLMPAHACSTLCLTRCAAAAAHQRFDAPTTYRQSVTESDPFGETFTQQWPVTPYELRVTNRSDAPVRHQRRHAVPRHLRAALRRCACHVGDLRAGARARTHRGCAGGDAVCQARRGGPHPGVQGQLQQARGGAAMKRSARAHAWALLTVCHACAAARRSGSSCSRCRGACHVARRTRTSS